MREFSREHRAVFEVKTAFAQFRPNVEDHEIADVTRSFDLFESAVCSFVLSELHFRQAERCRALKVQPELAAHSEAQGKSRNAAGVGDLQLALSILDRAAGSISKTSIKGSGGKKFEPAEAVRKLKEEIAYLEIKGSDATELGSLVDELFTKSVAGADSDQAFAALIAERLKNLAEVRGRADRGAQTNLPLWKLIAAAVALVVAVWIIYKCFFSRFRCSKAEKAIYEAVFVAAAVMFGACG
jgi:hypothetical protein